LSSLHLDVLGTRVARRVLALFTLGAVLPVAVMAVLSFGGVSTQLRQQNEERLIQLTDVLVQSILERLLGFSDVLRGAGLASNALGGDGASGDTAGQRIGLPPGVLGIALSVGGEVLPLAGEVGEVFELSPDDQRQLASDRAVLRVGRGAADDPISALMALPLDSPGSDGSVLWGRIVGDSIWARAVTRASSDPALSDLCVLDAFGSPLYCQSGHQSLLPNAILSPARREGASGRLEVVGPEEDYLAAWREVYLRSTFGAEAWTVAVSQPLSSVSATVNSFAYNLLISLVIGLAAVLLLTHVLVRRTMHPLRELTEGTRRIAAQDLTTRVDVDREDEFGELASSFNAMAERIGLQFKQLEARRAIDHAVVTSADHQDAVEALLEGVGQVVPSGPSAVLLSELDLPGAASIYTLHPGRGALTRELVEGYGAEDLLALSGERDRLARSEGQIPAIFRSWLANRPGMPVLVLPLRANGSLLGAMAVSGASGVDFGPEDSERAQQLADQAAVALEKLRLDHEVASMSWEALRALANAIDAKSKWTTGHSERVTALALVMGNELGLDSTEMEILQRGGLLHDIGKIGVPTTILDSPGKLTDEMWAIMQEHPVAGARILEPIRAFKPILPIVLYHHEQWSGGGYPKGLRGLEIPRLARLVAVADVFDAMVSARPYRPGIDADDVHDHIRSLSGVHFDPEMVQVFTRAMDMGWTPQDLETSGVAE
jgi:putative nucleotidyltransferase with HDIG domain